MLRTIKENLWPIAKECLVTLSIIAAIVAFSLLILVVGVGLGIVVITGKI